MDEHETLQQDFAVGAHGTVHVQVEDSRDLTGLLATCATAAEAAAARLPQLARSPLPWSLTLRLGTAEDGRKLNRDFRGKDYATNVLSFPADEEDAINDGADEWYVGDIFICTEVVAREAAEQDKPVLDHLTHLVVHGVLHLGGYDHLDDTEAEIMEALETDILAGLGIADPYADLDDQQPRAPDDRAG